MDKAFEALRVCVTEGKCTNTDCPYEYQCELIRNGQLQFIQIPKVLALDVLNRMKGKEAKWIQIDDDTNVWKCSLCEEPQMIIDGSPFENGWKYCPNCGAKMMVEVKNNG